MQIIQKTAHFQGWRHVQIVARLRRCPASHAVLSSLAACRGGRHFFMSGFLVSGGARATARWKAALLSLLVSEEALQGLDALVAPRRFLVGESNRRTV